MNKSFWKNKTVFITGHTGFKGSWLSIWLAKIGCNVIGYSLPSPTTPSLYQSSNIEDSITNIEGDIRDLDTLKTSIAKYKPDIVLHMAAQALVRESYDNPIETYMVNVIGTANVLEAIRGSESVKVFVGITTDKCYKKQDGPWGYKETDPLGGNDPYASSKAGSELVIHSYRKSFFQKQNTAIASVRAGNVIGGGDWAKDRIIPDAMRAFQTNKMLHIRNPHAVRPWQFVMEPIRGYLMLAEKLWDNPAGYEDGWNFGPNEDSSKEVGYIVKFLVNKWDGSTNWKLDTLENPPEDGFLRLDSSKARWKLGWKPMIHLDECLEWIVEWYQKQNNGENILEITENQLSRYEAICKIQ
ncbi:CDP-glucose 4,6-dehydratase [Puniceicoccaceae bacterium K14]|nr:CDP-glucose 4,6-dehydratase [Puniceicoccaceae bacterium K14]